MPGARYQTACAPAAAVNYVIAHSADVQQFRIVGTCTTRAHTTILKWALFFGEMFQLDYDICAVLHPKIGCHMVSSFGKQQEGAKLARSASSDVPHVSAKRVCCATPEETAAPLKINDDRPLQ